MVHGPIEECADALLDRLTTQQIIQQTWAPQGGTSEALLLKLRGDGVGQVPFNTAASGGNTRGAGGRRTLTLAPTLILTLTLAPILILTIAPTPTLFFTLTLALLLAPTLALIFTPILTRAGGGAQQLSDQAHPFRGHNDVTRIHVCVDFLFTLVRSHPDDVCASSRSRPNP